MSKKTIGLNPLEEYLSAPKNPKRVPKETQEKPKEQPEKKEEPKVQVAPKKAPEVQPQSVGSQTVQLPTVQEEQVVQAQPETALNEDVEIDGQGQLAIKGTKVPEVVKERPAKQRITLHISTELVDRIKNAVYWEPGLTVAGFAEEAFSDTIAALEKERGEPFPQRKHHRLRGGRPVS